MGDQFYNLLKSLKTERSHSIQKSSWAKICLLRYEKFALSHPRINPLTTPVGLNLMMDLLRGGMQVCSERYHGRDRCSDHPS